MDRRLGAQFFTIRDFCQTLEAFDESCKKVSAIGYKLVQLSGIGDFAAEDIKEILDKYGLTCVCTHRPPQRYLEHLEEEIQFHKILGCKVCGIGAMPGFKGDMPTIEAFAENFGPVCKKLAEHDLIFAYHNHAFEFEKINGRYAYEVLFERMPYDNFQLILDVYWLAYAGLNPAKFIAEHREYIACLHYKDLRVVDNTPEFAEVGAGNIEWDEVIAASENSSATCVLVEQDICRCDPFDSLKISYDYLTKKGFV